MRISDWSSDVCSSDLPRREEECRWSPIDRSRRPEDSYHEVERGGVKRPRSWERSTSTSSVQLSSGTTASAVIDPATAPIPPPPSSEGEPDSKRTRLDAPRYLPLHPAPLTRLWQ